MSKVHRHRHLNKLDGRCDSWQFIDNSQHYCQLSETYIASKTGKQCTGFRFLHINAKQHYEKLPNFVDDATSLRKFSYLEAVLSLYSCHLAVQRNPWCIESWHFAMINTSLFSGTVPECLKHAVFHPLLIKHNLESLSQNFHNLWSFPVRWFHTTETALFFLKVATELLLAVDTGDCCSRLKSNFCLGRDNKHGIFSCTIPEGDIKTIPLYFKTWK